MFQNGNTKSFCKLLVHTNYASIKIQLWDGTGTPVYLTRLDYLGENGLSNGTTIRLANGQTKKITIYLRMVNSANDSFIAVNPTRKYG